MRYYLDKAYDMPETVSTMEPLAAYITYTSHDVRTTAVTYRVSTVSITSLQLFLAPRRAIGLANQTAQKAMASVGQPANETGVAIGRMQSTWVRIAIMAED